MNDLNEVWTVLMQICKCIGGLAAFFIAYKLVKKYVFGPEGVLNKPSTTYATEEERLAAAKSLGEEGSKTAMKESLEKRGKISCILLVAGLILLCIWPIAGVALLVAAIYYLNHGSSKDYAEGRDTDTLYRVNFLDPALDKIFPEGHEVVRGKLLDDNSVLSALPSMRDTPFEKFLDGHDLFTFTHKGVPMSMSHNSCTVQTGTDEDGDPTYSRVWEGQVYETKYKTRLMGYARVVPTVTHLGHEKTGIYMAQRKNEVKVETDNIYFNEHFDVYATSQQDALFVLNPVVINYFTDFAQNGGKQAMFVSGDTLVITRQDVSYDVFDPPRSLEQIDALSVEGKCKQFAFIADTCLDMLEAINGKSAV